MAKLTRGGMAMDEAQRDENLDEQSKDTGKIKSRDMVIEPPKFITAEFVIEGTSPFVQNKFSQKAIDQMKGKMVAGQQAQKGKKREPKDFKACYEGAMHRMDDGSCGIPTPAFRSAMISACKLVGFKMTQAKLTIFVEPDGFDTEDGTPLVKITRGKPEYFEAAVRNQTGVADIRPRPMWKPGWRATIRIRFDSDIFSQDDVANLLSRAGMQVGVGEGRPDSKKSNGMGWGLFRPLNKEEFSK